MSSGINISIKGHDLEDIEAVANRISEIVRDVDGVSKANSNLPFSIKKRPAGWQVVLQYVIRLRYRP
jgi:hypothetical protein